MHTFINAHSSRHRRIARATVVVIAAGALLAAGACDSDGDTSTAATIGPAPPTTVASSTSNSRPVPATAIPQPAPPTSPAPTPEPPEKPSKEDRARRALLRPILASHRAAGEFVGARIAVLDPDGGFTEVAAGTTTVDPAAGPVDPEVTWNIGSATKTFVAVVALQLADEGRIDLDEDIARFVPELPGARRITPRQLLQHTSGLGEYLDQPAVQSHLRRNWTAAELIAVAEAAGRVGEPGGPYHYSNTNYIVLGEIIERVTGNSWAAEVRTRIAEPLGMTRTDAITDERPVGYQIVDGSFVDVTESNNPSVGGAAGGLQSTGRDLVRFAAALRDGTLLSRRSQRAMRAFAPGEDLSQYGIDHSYGLGFERYAADGVTVLGHMGTGQTGSSFIGYDAERGTAIAVTTNTGVAGPQAMMTLEALVALAGA
jgi:D-alanyl-D-alanine carboxypeptidase